ncbi:hypothetical protein [Rhodococcus sp. NPDC127528]|uniref:hypothetical protein n=1 Tax=unclassified Rhodococcus (in: high G+C Gram-positive bacteria) TaxID=192944 RepID=UPI0036283071
MTTPAGLPHENEIVELYQQLQTNPNAHHASAVAPTGQLQFATIDRATGEVREHVTVDDARAAAPDHGAAVYHRMASPPWDWELVERTDT